MAATWPVGPRLDELVHRAKQFRRSSKNDGTPALPFIPDKGNNSLPVSRPDRNPNLVWVYVDAQFDYLEGRVYLLGALVVACENGTPARRRSVVRMTVAARRERNAIRFRHAGPFSPPGRIPRIRSPGGGPPAGPLRSEW